MTTHSIKNKRTAKSGVHRKEQRKRAQERANNLYGDSLNQLLAIRTNLEFKKLGVSGPESQPIHSCFVEVDGKIFLGKGQNQNESKMHAASLALKSLDPTYGMKILNSSEQNANESCEVNGNDRKIKEERKRQTRRNNAKQRAMDLYGDSLNELFAIRKNIEFKELGVTGPESNTEYTISVEVDNKLFIGQGRSKHEAKMHAAALALKRIDPSYEMKNLNLSEEIINKNDETLSSNENDGKKKNENKSATLSDKKPKNQIRFRRYRDSLNRTRNIYGNSLMKLEKCGKQFTFSQLKPTEESQYYFSLKVDGREFFGKGDSTIEAKAHASFEALQTIGCHELNGDANLLKENHNDLDDLIEICPDIEFRLVKTVFSVSTQIDGKTFVGCGESYNEAKTDAASIAIKGIFLSDDSGNCEDTNDDIQSFDHAYLILSKILPKLEYKNVLKDRQDGRETPINVVTVQIDELTFSAESEQKEDAVNRVAATILKNIFNLVYEEK